MRRAILLGLLTIACTSSTPEPSEPAAPRPPPPTGECAPEITDYLAQREQLAYCETDSDCAEIGPGLCPYGPYYIHREADIDAVVALERAIMARCELPECEPMELGIAHCEQGTCARGRKPEHKRELGPRYNYDMSCWDYRETWLEADGVASATTSSVLNGVTPLLAIAPASAGTLVLELDWPASCPDCRLLISEHNSGMARLMTPKATRSAATRDGQPVSRERLELPVTPGPYWLVGLADVDSTYGIRAELRDAEGEPGRVTTHGVGWQHMCEG